MQNPAVRWTAADPPNKCDSLGALMDAIALRNIVAFARLKAATSTLLFGIAHRYLRNREDADEIVGDVYIRVWYQSHRFDPKKGTVRGWLSIMCRNAAIDRSRRARFHQINDAIDLNADPVTFLTPETILERSQFHRLLASAIGGLPYPQRHMLTLSFDEGLSHREISTTYDIPLGTVKSHLNRSLKRLQRELNTVSPGTF